MAQEKQERQGEERGEGLKRALELLSKNPETRRPYVWVVKKEFARISKILKEGWTFEAIYEHLATFKFLPENGDAESLRQAYRREEKKRRQAEGEGSKTDNDTQKRAIPPATPTPPPVFKPPVQPTQSLPPLPIMGQPVVNRENETDEERRLRIRRELGTVINTGTSRIIKHSDGTFDVLDDDGNILDNYVKPKF